MEKELIPTEEQIRKIKDWCDRVSARYENGGATDAWWKIEGEFHDWQVQEFGRRLYPTELEKFGN